MSLALNGSNYVALNLVPLNAYPYIIAFRFRTSAAIPAVGNFWSAATAIPGQYHSIQLRSGNPDVRAERNDNVSLFGLSFVVTAISLNAWHSVIVYYSAPNSGLVYFDGVAGNVDTTNFNIFTQMSMNRLEFGRDAGSLTNFFTGNIADMTMVNGGSVTANQAIDYHNGVRGNVMWTPSWYANWETSLTQQVGSGTLTANGGATIDANLNPSLLSSPMKHFSEIPYVYTKPNERETFRSLLFDDYATAKRIAVLGDSTSADIGAQGMRQMSWRRHLWHNLRGNTPGTQLLPPLITVGDVTQNWLAKAHNVNLSQASPPAAYALANLPPGWQIAGGAVAKARLGTGEEGFFLQLNHRNDDESTTAADGNFTNTHPANAGFDFVPEARGGGRPEYATSHLFGGRSYIDVKAGLRLEVVALTNTGSVADVTWNVRPMSQMHQQQVSATVTQTGTLFGGGSTLNAAAGTVRIAQTPVLNSTLGGPNKWIQIQVAGNTASADPNVWAWIFGCRIVSENQKGLIFDTFSLGGYTSSHFVDNHSGCAFVLDALNHDAIWMFYGTNDSGIGAHPGVYAANLRRSIAFYRTAVGTPTLPVIVEVPLYRTNELSSGSAIPAADYYAAAAYDIALNDANVMFINSRRLTQDYYAWDATNRAKYMLDEGGSFVHYNDVGAEALAKSVIIHGICKHFDIPYKSQAGYDSVTASADGKSLFIKWISSDSGWIGIVSKSNRNHLVITVTNPDPDYNRTIFVEPAVNTVISDLYPALNDNKVLTAEYRLPLTEIFYKNDTAILNAPNGLFSEGDARETGAIVNAVIPLSHLITQAVTSSAPKWAKDERHRYPPIW